MSAPGMRKTVLHHCMPRWAHTHTAWDGSMLEGRTNIQLTIKVLSQFVRY
jgi:hypothetical protein